MKTSVLDTSLSVHLLSSIFDLHKFYCKVLAWLVIMCPEIEHWNDKKWSTIHQLRLRLSITIDFNSSPRVHINYQLKGHNHEDKCDITQNRTKHFIHPYSTKEEQPQEIMVVDSLINSSRYSSCRYLVYFPKTLSKYRRLCRLRAWWQVWTVDPRELRGCGEWSCRVLQNTRTPSRIGDITKPWTLCLDWGRWKDDTNCGYTALSLSSPDSVTFISWVCFLHFVRTRQNM